MQQMHKLYCVKSLRITDTSDAGQRSRAYAHPPNENRPEFSRYRLKIPACFPATQGAHRLAAAVRSLPVSRQVGITH